MHPLEITTMRDSRTASYLASDDEHSLNERIGDIHQGTTHPTARPFELIAVWTEVGSISEVGWP